MSLAVEEPQASGMLSAAKCLVVIVWLLNAYDMVITLYAVNCLNATEQNPLMRFCLEFDPLLFVFVKMSTATIVSVVLWHRGHEQAKKTLVLLAGIFGALAYICAWNTYGVLRGLGIVP